MNHPVQRHVLRNLPAHPVAVRASGRLAQALRIDQQQVAEVQRPEVGELPPFQQAGDDLGAAVGGRRLGQKRPDFGGGGQSSDEVEVDAAEECRVVGHGGWRDAHPPQFRPHRTVYKVLRRERRGVEFPVAKRGSDSDRRNLPPVADHDVGDAAAYDRNRPVVRDLRDRVVIGTEKRVVGDVGGRPVRERRTHTETHLVARTGDEHVRRRNIDSVHPQVAGAEGGAGFEPIDQRFVVSRTEFDPFAALVADVACCLSKEQTPGR